MTPKLFPMNALVCALFFLIPALSQACNINEHRTLEQEKNQLSDLSKEGGHAILYNFRSERCTPVSNAHNELDMSAFLPSDETSLGMYQVFRDEGESQIDALKHALTSLIDENQS